jgi:hypothetical protein
MSNTCGFGSVLVDANTPELVIADLEPAVLLDFHRGRDHFLVGTDEKG